MQAGLTKVCILGVVALFGDCRDIPIDLGVIVKQIWYVHLSKRRFDINIDISKESNYLLILTENEY